MIEAHHYLDLEGLTKARTEKICTTRTCGRMIHRGEYYSLYMHRGESLDCIVCVAKHQILFHRQRANDLEKWLKEIGE